MKVFRRIVLPSLLLLLSFQLLISCTTSTPHFDSKASTPNNLSTVDFPYPIEEQIGDTVFQDDFSSTPLGYNRDIWEIKSFGEQTISWEDNTVLGLSVGSFTHSIFSSSTKFSVEAVMQVSFSFTFGDCYFGIGWAERADTLANEYVVDLRRSENGVFIDYWDGSLFLTTIKDGERAVVKSREIDLRNMHTFTLSWSESMVRLEIDGFQSLYITDYIPVYDMFCHFTLSGNHYLSGFDTLRLDFIKIHSLEEPEMEEPEVRLLWPTNNSHLYETDLINLHQFGSSQPLNYSIDEQTWHMSHSPWDISCSNISGMVVLFVKTLNEPDNPERFIFNRIEPESFNIRSVDSNLAQIDGVSSQKEINDFGKSTLNFRDEGGWNSSGTMVAGYSGDKLYLCLEYEINCGYYTHIILLLDCNSDSLWHHGSEVDADDVAISVAAPTASAGYSKVMTSQGYEIPSGTIKGLETASGYQSGVLCTEFLIPLSLMGKNNSDSVSFGLQIVEGGIVHSFPASFQEDSQTLTRIHPNQSVPILFSLYSIFLLIFVSFIGVAIFYLFQRNRLLLLSRGIESDVIDRFETLLSSYDMIPVEKILQMVDLEEEKLESVISILNKRNQATRIFIRDRVIHRTIVDEE